MPTITDQGKTFTCDRSANLREVLVEEGIELYNGESKLINCIGMGTCGTCTVLVQGEVSAQGWSEKLRLSLPPHKRGRNRRLACQTQVLGDIRVTKFEGLWGQGGCSIWTPES